MDKVTKTLKTTSLTYRRNDYHRVYNCYSANSGEPYQITLDWLNVNGVPTLKTYVLSYDPKLSHPAFGDTPKKDHPSNFNRTICHMSLAVAKFAAKESGKVLSICKSREAAENLLRFGGRLVNIVNLGGGSVWATVR